MKTTLALSSLIILVLFNSAFADTFASGANSFNIDFVTIGNPGNAADTTGFPNPGGSVSYTYRMGKFEISEQMIDKANTLGALGITKDTRGPDKPATSISWNEAARFVNWLNTSTGSTPAYKFALQPGEVGYNANANILLWTPSDPGYDPNNLYRNSLASYFLPGANEWYKAAYYDPTSGVYYDYPTGSNTAPTPVASGTAAGTAVYATQFTQYNGPADITLAGGLSPYGTMAQGGNEYEWVETDFDLVNGPSSDGRGVRGGVWNDDSFGLRSVYCNIDMPTHELNVNSFRIARTAIPEPSTLLLTISAFAAVLTRRRKSVPRNRV
jgi:formylglycine-generating enzyme